MNALVAPMAERSDDRSERSWVQFPPKALPHRGYGSVVQWQNS